MKTLFFVSVLALSSLSFAADWKVVAETEDCAEKVQILARAGEKYVIAAQGEIKEKLFSTDGSAFSADSMKTTEFTSNTKEKRNLGQPTFTFTHPSLVEANPPKLDVFFSGRKEHCRMGLK